MSHISHLNCYDFLEEPDEGYCYDLAADDLSGINYVTDLAFSNLGSIMLDGIEYQYQAFWERLTNSLVIQTRKNRGTWNTFRYNGAKGLLDIDCLDITDAHYGITLCADPDGYLHISYNNHDTQVVYRMSTNPIQTFDGT
jgi:hypothetical protein